MNPTFKPGDLLEVVPYGEISVSPGDVIVFRKPDGADGEGGGASVTHRVIAVRDGGVIARGDNNIHADPWLISDSNIIGRVTHAERRGRRVRVYGGAVGLAYSHMLHAARRADSLVCLILRRAYRGLAESGVVRRLLPSPVKVRVVSLNRPGGTELVLLLGRSVIGRLLPKGRWQIRRPFRLLVDEASLPCPCPEDLTPGR